MFFLGLFSLLFLFARAENCVFFNLDCQQENASLSLNETCFNLTEPTFGRNLTNLYVAKIPELIDISFPDDSCQLEKRMIVSYSSCFNQTKAYVVHAIEIDGDIVHLTASQELTCTEAAQAGLGLKLSRKSVSGFWKSFNESRVAAFL